MSNREKLHVFISSPGDVAEERVVARRILERLDASFGDRIDIVPIVWEHEPMRASASFQEQIRDPSNCDIVLVILWSRLGTRLPAHIQRPDGSRYASGTEFEFENALEAWREKGVPDLLVYRKTARPVTPLDSEQKVLARLEQKKALDAFIDRWFRSEDGSFTAAFHAFGELADFEELLETHLGKLLKERLPAVAGETSRSIEWDQGSPYRGLHTFDTEHADIFFGRTQAASEVLTALRQQAAEDRPFVLLLGMSGCGKSSLARAGVVPILTQPGVIEGIDSWRSAVVRPSDHGSDPIQSLASALLKESALPELGADGTDAETLAAQLRQNPDSASALIKGGLSQASALAAQKQSLDRQPDSRLVLVIDQMEELFTMPAVTDDHRLCFMAVISSMVSGGKTWVLATLRSDFYGRMVELPGLLELKKGAGLYDVQPASSAEVGQMIRRPAELAGLRFEEDETTGERLDDLLRDAAASNPEVLPLLQFTLDQLYTSRNDQGVLTLSAYQELGGLEGALAQRAESAFNALPESDRTAFSAVMSTLVAINPGDGSAGSRQWVELDSFPAGGPGRSLVDQLVEARLLVTDRDQTGAPVVTLAHEALLQHWPRLHDWLEHNRQLLRIRERLDQAARQWDADGRPASSLLASAKRLEEAAGLMQSDSIRLPKREKAFLQASMARGRKMQWLKRAAIGSLCVLAVVAIGAAWFAEGQRRDSETARGQSEAVTQFLGDMLASVDPESLGRDVLVKDVLDEASVNIEDLNHQPLIQARLMNTMGNAYSSLGLYPEAGALLQQGLSIRKTQLDPGDLQIAASMHSLGTLRNLTGDYEQAIELLEQALAIREAADPPEPVAVADTLNGLGAAYTNSGEYEKSLQIYHRALTLLEQTAGPEDAALISPLNNLGQLLSQLGRQDEARPYLERAAEISEHTLGPDHRKLAIILDNLGILHARKGEFDEARPLFTRSLQILEKTSGPDHPETGRIAFHLGILHAQTGDYKRALPLFERGAAINLEMLGPDHPTVANDLNNLGSLNMDLGRPETALPLFERALEIRENALGPEHPDTAFSCRELAMALLELGEVERAEQLFQRALTIQEATLPDDSPQLALTLAEYARLLETTGRDDEAVSMQKRADDIQNKGQ